jgi:hypothetical protein
MKEAILILLLALIVSTQELLLLSKTSPTLKKETVFIPRQNREMPMKAREGKRVNSEKNKSLKFFLPHRSPVLFMSICREKTCYKFIKGIFP